MVPGKTGHVRNTSGGAFTKQTYGGTIIGLTTATSIITKAISVKDVNPVDITITTLPKELSGARTYNTAKVLSGGTFAYNAAKNRTWVITRITTSLAGVSKTFLQFMGSALPGKIFPYYNARRWVNTVSLVHKSQFSRTGYDSNGNKISKRTTWITDPTSTSGADFGTSGSLPSRAFPGEGYFLTNFVDLNPATSSNKFNYKPITGK